MTQRIADIITATLTRPADTTPYAAGDLVANSTTAGSVTPLTFNAGASQGSVLFARIRKTNTGVSNAVFRLHLFTVSPTVTNGDNGAFLASGPTGYLGWIDIVVDKAFASGAYGDGVADFLDVPFVLAGTLYGLLESRLAYPPGNAEVFTVEIGVARR